MIHVTYDLSGIQRFIFQVPRLRSIVGGSKLIDRFDRESVGRIASELEGVELQFAGGGHGHFSCSDATIAGRLVEKIVGAAHKDGMGVRIGRSENVEDAINDASEDYPFLPRDLEGEPCADSGLYPVTRGLGRGESRDVHPVVWRRVRDQEGRVRDRLEKWALDELKSGRYGELPPRLLDRELIFFSDVSPEIGNDQDGDHPGILGRAALGNRNRWAVVAMDGNDLGSQFRALGAEDLAGRATRAKAVDEIGREAFLRATAELIRTWVNRFPEQARKASGESPEGQAITVLPIRPLVIGGDDIIAICHPALAVPFVRTAIRCFEEASARHAALWKLTGGKLTVSAGILFAPTGYPLHTAIPYAESLLGSAKGLGRALRNEGAPPPACIDWESVTEGLLDTPTARRRRELQFIDADRATSTEVRLTSRPYPDSRLDELFRLVAFFDNERIPATTIHGLQAGLRQGYFGRLAYRARIGKNHPQLAAMIDEDGPRSRWKLKKSSAGEYLTLDVLDAVSIWKEEARLEKETVR